MKPLCAIALDCSDVWTPSTLAHTQTAHESADKHGKKIGARCGNRTWNACEKAGVFCRWAAIAAFKTANSFKKRFAELDLFGPNP